MFVVVLMVITGEHFRRKWRIMLPTFLCWRQRGVLASPWLGAPGLTSEGWRSGLRLGPPKETKITEITTQPLEPLFQWNHIQGWVKQVSYISITLPGSERYRLALHIHSHIVTDAEPLHLETSNCFHEWGLCICARTWGRKTRIIKMLTACDIFSDFARLIVFATASWHWCPGATVRTEVARWHMLPTMLWWCMSECSRPRVVFTAPPRAQRRHHASYYDMKGGSGEKWRECREWK